MRCRLCGAGFAEGLRRCPACGAAWLSDEPAAESESRRIEFVLATLGLLGLVIGLLGLIGLAWWIFKDKPIDAGLVAVLVWPFLVGIAVAIFVKPSAPPVIVLGLLCLGLPPALGMVGASIALFFVAPLFFGVSLAGAVIVILTKACIQKLRKWSG